MCTQSQQTKPLHSNEITHFSEVISGLRLAPCPLKQTDSRVVEGGLASWALRLVDARGSESMPMDRAGIGERASWLGGWVAGWLATTSWQRRAGFVDARESMPTC